MAIKKLGVTVLSLALFNPSAWAGEKEDLEKLRGTTKGLIQLLVEQGAITKEKSGELMSEIEKSPAETETPEEEVDKKTVRVPYVPETVKQEMTEQIRKDVLAQAKREQWGKPGAIPDWAQKIKWEGDLRLRSQGDMFQSDNATFFYKNYLEINRVGGDANTNNPYLNTTEDRQRFRLRARLSMLAEVTQGVTAAFRLATGSANDPVSTNQTLGNMGNRFNFMLDQAYVKLEPYQWLTVAGGKIPNPWFGTDLVWDEDLNFDGAAVQFKPRIGNELVWFSTLGAFPLQEIELSKKDKWLYGAQTGVDWNRSQFRARFGVAYYDYQNITGQINTAPGSHLLDFTAPQFVQKGNTMFDISQTQNQNLYALASEYKELNITANLDIYTFSPVHVTLTGDYVKNVGFKKEDIVRRTGRDVGQQNQAYMGRVAVGMPRIKHRHDWQVFGGYKHLESDAVLDAFTDSDFHLGGTNAKGWIAGGSYGVATDTWLTLRWLSADQIVGPPLAIDVMQLDLNVRF
ncbi:MAG: putative porin [Gammaproteobacteria bacterium]